MNRPTLAQRLENLPPFLAYYMARKRAPRMTPEQRRSRWSKLNKVRRKRNQPKRLYGWRLLTHREIAKKSGLKYSHVRTISKQITWEHIKTTDMVKFLEGCGIELTRLHRTNQFLSECLKRPYFMSGVPEYRFKRFANLAARKAAAEKIERAII